mmetsp:Transcript_21941/g.56164  ORF Transcript_21941/g.56164 Transcript_21941/m.56164 type:complete len:362 (+) Transcript_21941:1322-2407(+)
MILGNSSEQRVLQLGLRRLAEGLAAPRGSALETLPMRKNGSQLILTPSFFLRLLKEEAELKSCCASDVSAAQHDLRFLDCDQLLTIRAGTLDFVTDSGSHSAHNNFLASLDNHLFGKLAQRCSRGAALAEPVPSEEALRSLSLQIALIAGATEALRIDELQKSTGREVPKCWAVQLDPGQWSGSRVALFHSDELQVDVLPADAPDFVRSAAGSHIAVTQARTSFIGRDKRLHWRISLHDPATEDIVAEMELAAEGGDKQQKMLAEELGSALKMRSVVRTTESQVLELERRMNSGRGHQASPIDAASPVAVEARGGEGDGDGDGFELRPSAAALAAKWEQRPPPMPSLSATWGSGRGAGGGG